MEALSRTVVGGGFSVVQCGFQGGLGKREIDGLDGNAILIRSGAF